jgi:predicted nucleic acid-binding protein
MMSRIYLDTSVVIGLVEGTEGRRAVLDSRLELTRTGSDVVFVSELVRYECLVGPRRNGNEALAFAFEQFFQAEKISVLPVDRTVFDRAIDIRARERFSTPDALHLAAALVSRCDVFLTGDRELACFDGIPVEVL